MKSNQDHIEAALVLLEHGLPFESHELMEHFWREAEGPDKELFQGLAQAAAALVHQKNNNSSGANSLWLKAQEKLGSLSPAQRKRLEVLKKS